MAEEYENLTAEEKVEAMEKELGELRPIKDSSQKLQEEYRQKEEAWNKEKTDLEQAANPNWQKARKYMGVMKAALKEKGVEVDEEGNVISGQQNINLAEVEQKARDAARSELLGGRLEELLEEYDEESGKLVKHYFNKLTSGEGVTLQNIKGFINQAENVARTASGTEVKKRAFTFGGGRGPKQQEETEGKLDDSTAKELGSRMGLGFAKEEKK